MRRAATLWTGVCVLLAGAVQAQPARLCALTFSCPAIMAEDGEAGDDDPTAPARSGLASDWLLGRQAVERGMPLYWDVWAPPLATGALYAVLELTLEPPRDERWVGRNGFDDGIRDALRAGSRSGRESASAASDALVAGLGAALIADRALARTTYPFATSLAADATWFFATGTFTRVTKVSAGRQRPYVEPCESDPDYSDDCNTSRDDNASFIGGHAAEAGTLAGLLCSRHRDLLAWDGLWCVGGMGATIGTGLLRMTADKHWATDVIAGWGTGAVFGYVLPTYVWPAWRDAQREPALTDPVTHLRALHPLVGPGRIGLQYALRF